MMPYKLSLLGSPGSINHKGCTTGVAAWLVNSTIPRPRKTLEMQQKCSYSQARRCLRN